MRKYWIDNLRWVTADIINVMIMTAITLFIPFTIFQFLIV